MRINRDRLALEMRRARVPFVVYLGLIATGLAALYGILRNQTFLRPWEDHIEVRAVVDDAKGLVPGKQEVRIAGVKVGVVTGSDLAGGHPVVTLKLEREHGPVFRDARVRIRPVTPLQDMYVDLRRGTPGAGELRASDVIPQERTVTPVDISRVLNTFDAETRDRLGTLLRQLDAGLRDNGEQLRAAFVQAVPFLQAAQRTTEVLAERRTTLRRLVSNFGRLTETLGDHDEQLATLVTRGDTTLGELARRDRPLSETIAQLAPMLTALDAAMARVGAARTELDPALVALRPAARGLDDGLQGLERLARDALPAFTALQEPVRRLRPLARNLHPAADALAEAFVELEGQAPAFDRITGALLPCREMTRQFLSHTPSVLKFGNAYSSYPRGDVSFDVGSLGARSSHGLSRSASCTDQK